MGKEQATVKVNPAPIRRPATQVIGDLARLRAVTGKTHVVIESQVQGASMGTAIPDGAHIRIRAGEAEELHTGKVIAFLTKSRVMVHRVVYEGRRGAARHFVITQGDGNWLCDPPVERSCIVGEVQSLAFEGEWRPIGAARMPVFRRLVARTSQALMRLALDCNPAFAVWISRPISRLRMAPRLVWLRLRLYFADHVRN
jgi:hypothetical protein